MRYDITRTDRAINQQIDEADAIIETGASKFHGMSYEEGVRQAILWITGVWDDAPFELEVDDE